MATDDVIECTTQEAWELLRGHELGRLAFHLLGEVHLVPVNYATDGRFIYFASAPGSKLLGLTLDDDVAFEIDEIDNHRGAISVVVRGNARVLSPGEATVVESLPLRPWVPGDRNEIVRISVTEISGRRFHLHRPWLHDRPEHD